MKNPEGLMRNKQTRLWHRLLARTGTANKELWVLTWSLQYILCIAGEKKMMSCEKRMSSWVLISYKNNNQKKKREREDLTPRNVELAPVLGYSRDELPLPR